MISTATPFCPVAIPTRVALPAAAAPQSELARAAALSARESTGDGVTLGAVKQEASEMLTGALRSYQALPSFLYPSVTGTAVEKAMIMETLDRLPLKDVASTPAIRMLPSLDFLNKGPGTIMGVTVGSGDIAISRSGVTMPDGRIDPDVMRYVIIHENGHSHDFDGGLLKTFFFRESNSKPWGTSPFPTRYAETMKAEDFAEAHAFYHQTPEELERVKYITGARTTKLEEYNPEKYRAMARAEQPNFLERIVEQKPFRETGRAFGQMLSSPVGSVAHSVLGFARLSGAVSLIGEGITSTVSAATSPGSKAGVAPGLLTLGAGLSLGFGFASPLLGPTALALLGAKKGLEVAEEAGREQTATKVAAAVGGALGGVVGGVAGPLAGTLAGYTIGGPIGGVVGLVAGSLVGFRGGTALGAKAGLAIAS